MFQAQLRQGGRQREEGGGRLSGPSSEEVLFCAETRSDGPVSCPRQRKRVPRGECGVLLESAREGGHGRQRRGAPCEREKGGRARQGRGGHHLVVVGRSRRSVVLVVGWSPPPCRSVVRSSRAVVIGLENGHRGKRGHHPCP